MEMSGLADAALASKPCRPRRMSVSLNAALSRLHGILEALPKGNRRAAIEGLSKQLRHELIKFMEARRLHVCSAAPQPRRRVQMVKPLARMPGSVWTFKTPSAQYHRARCQIGGVLVRSSSVRCRAQAEALLQRLHAALSEVPEQLEQRLPAAAAALSLQSCTVSFVVVLDARRWIGRSLESPTLYSLAETLTWRRRAAEAEAGGWPRVRALWMDRAFGQTLTACARTRANCAHMHSFVMFHSMFRISVLPVLAMSRRHVKSTAWRLLEISPFPAKLQGSVLARQNRMAQLPAELMCPLHTRANTLRSPPEVPRTVNANRNVKRSSPGSRLAAAGAAASRSRGTRRAIAGLGHGAKVGSVQETSGKSLEAQGGESWTANLHLFYIQIPVFIRALSLRDLGTATFQDFSCLEFAVVLSGQQDLKEDVRSWDLGDTSAKECCSDLQCYHANNEYSIHDMFRGSSEVAVKFKEAEEDAKVSPTLEEFAACLREEVRSLLHQELGHFQTKLLQELREELRQVQEDRAGENQYQFDTPKKRRGKQEEIQTPEKVDAPVAPVDLPLSLSERQSRRKQVQLLHTYRMDLDDEAPTSQPANQEGRDSDNCTSGCEAPVSSLEAEFNASWEEVCAPSIPVAMDATGAPHADMEAHDLSSTSALSSTQASAEFAALPALLKMEVLNWLPANQLCRSRSISQDFVDMKVLALELWYRADVFNVDGIVRTSLWQDGSAAEVQERRDCILCLETLITRFFIAEPQMMAHIAGALVGHMLEGHTFDCVWRPSGAAAGAAAAVAAADDDDVLAVDMLKVFHGRLARFFLRGMIWMVLSGNGPCTCTSWGLQ
ncbi:gsp-2 [Symbiodinium natans]|uniref:Gsp-2 protein n=1 Tax=Symbiodinium natans TaxID=878477 RepID=A0A812KK13_9DINO|nr:gsp-2 [Symbiodinium natans]